MLAFKSFSKYVLLTLSLYLTWLLFYQFYLLPSTLVDEYLIHGLVNLSEFGLKSLGFNVSHNTGEFYHTILIDSYSSVWISSHCDGLSVVAVFSVVLCTIPGSNKKRLYFLPVGILVIEFVNVLRIICLSLIHRYYPDLLKFNHDFTFTFLIYGVVVVMWWWWIYLNRDKRTI